MNRSSVFKPLSPWPLAQRSWVQVLILLGKRSLTPEKEKTSIHDCLCLCKFCQVAFRRHISLRLFTQREFLQGVSSPLHYVHFVKYDVTVSFDDAVSDTIRRRGGDRGIFTEEGVDTVAYFGGNHGFRV